MNSGYDSLWGKDSISEDAPVVNGSNEIDPVWEEDRIREDAPEIENGGLPEMIDVLEYEMPSTLESARCSGVVPRERPQEVPYLEDLEMDSSLLLPPEDWRGPDAAAPPQTMDGANSEPSVKLGSGSEPASDESRANKFPDEEVFIGRQRRDSRIPLPLPQEPHEESDPSSNSSVLLASDDNRRSQPWVRRFVFDIQDDEITEAPPLWDEVDEVDVVEDCVSPRQAGVGPGAFNPDPSARNTRTIRQRIASARQALREMVQEDREWIRGAMVRLHIKSEPDPGENERPPAPLPEPVRDRATRREKSSRGTGFRARVTPYLNLRGGSGSGTTPPSDSDIPPIDLSRPRTRSGDRSQDTAHQGDQAQNNSHQGEQSQYSTPVGGQPQDTAPPSGSSQDNSRSGGQSQDNTRPGEQSQGNAPGEQSQNNTPPSGELHDSGPRPLLSPSRQLHRSFRSPGRGESFNSISQVSNQETLPSPSQQARDSFYTVQRDSGPLPRPPYSPHPLHGPPLRGLPIPQQLGSTNQPQYPRPEEYTHPLARLAAYQHRLQNEQQELHSEAAARGTGDGSPYARPPSRHGYRQYDRRNSEPGDNARGDDFSSGPPGYNIVNSPAHQNGGRNVSRDASHDTNQDASQARNQNTGQNADQNAGQNTGRNTGRNTGQNVHRRVPSPLVEDFYNTHAPPAGRRVRLRASLSTFGKETGNKIKEKTSKFASLGRKPKQEPTGGVLEPATPESQTAPARTADTPPRQAASLSSRAAALLLRATSTTPQAAASARPAAAPVHPTAPLPGSTQPPTAPPRRAGHASSGDPEPGVTVYEEVYATNSLNRGFSIRFNMWPFNRNKRNH
ncbi:hypothetical protein VE03_08097 [Pseudogymnoascus sp. 23342-1-I1]|nr:hypothetical protein VE03_08097 [Pseudogymnoascus sp. 23342-1-I1]